MNASTWREIPAAGLGIILMFQINIALAGPAGRDSLAGDSSTTAENASAAARGETEDFSFSRADLLNSLSVEMRGDIRFSEDYRTIDAMAPGSYLQIEERRWLTTRRLEVSADAQGNPQYRFFMRSRSLPFDERAQAWLAEILPEVIRETGINAQARVQELLSRGGVAAVLREISRIDRNETKRSYFSALVESHTLTPEEAARVIRQASRQISGSSTLNQTLCEIAEKLPANESLTVELFRGAEKIPSSSQKSAAIIFIARRREIGSEAAIAMAQSIRSIPSSSEAARALETMADVCPADDAVISAYLTAAGSIPSSSQRANALCAIIQAGGLSPQSWIEIARSAAAIPSDSEQSRVLREMAKRCPGDEAVMRAYLRSAADISSSHEKANVLVAGLEKANLSEPVFVNIAETVSAIPSSAEQGRVLQAMAPLCPVSDAVVSAYLDAALEISSSAEQEAALLALLQREEISEEMLKNISQRAGAEISSRSARQAVIDRAAERMKED